MKNLSEVIKMKKNGRRILSVILTAVMVFALLPVFGKPMVVKAETTPTSNHAHGAYADKTCSEHAEWSEISSQADLKTLCEGGGNGYARLSDDRPRQHVRGGVVLRRMFKVQCRRQKSRQKYH